MPSVLATAVFLLYIYFLLHAQAAPLRLDLPRILPDPVPSDRDNTYGPWEKNSWIGSHPDDVHRDDLWPPLVAPAAAVRRTAPKLNTTLSTAKTNIVESTSRPGCFHIFPPEIAPPLFLLHGCHRCTPHSRLSVHSSSATRTIQGRGFSTATTSVDLAPLYTGAQQWQEYWVHAASGSPIQTPLGQPNFTSQQTLATIIRSGSSSTTRATKATSTRTQSSTGPPLSTGTKQWQEYWNHVAPRQLLTEDRKFDVFAEIFALPEHLTTTIVILSQSLMQLGSEPQMHVQETQHPGPIAAMVMCGVVGQTLALGNLQGENSSTQLAGAISTTCRSLAKLYPRHKFQAQSVTKSQRLIITKMFGFFGRSSQTQILSAYSVSKEAFVELLVSVNGINESHSKYLELVEHRHPLNQLARHEPLSNNPSRRTITSPPSEVHEIEIHSTAYSKTPARTAQIESSCNRVILNGTRIPNRDTQFHSKTPTRTSQIEYVCDKIIIHGTRIPDAHKKLETRDFYLFQPLEQAYTWLNDIYDIATGIHPHYPYNDPEQNINGCIYYPSPDHAAITGKVICPDDKKRKQRRRRTWLEIIKNVSNI